MVFSTTEDLLEEGPPNEGDEVEGEETGSVPRDKPVSFNAAVAARLSEHLEVDLTKQSRITFGDVHAGVTVTCSVSKEYEDPKGAGYWFAFHPHQLEKLEAAERGYAAFGCGSGDQVALLPVDFLKAQLGGMNQTRVDDGRSYWHIQIHREGATWILHRRKDEDWPDISDRMILRVGGGS